jgi:hypothetical protein
MLLLAVGSAMGLSSPAWGAIGCTLTNPAQDLKYLFPEVTSFKEDVRGFRSLPDGKTRFDSLKERLDSDLDSVYETFDTPYTVYLVFKGEVLIGIVHGVNVPGRGGVIQVFLSVDPETGEIRRFFFQRLESPEARKLKNQDFRKKFDGLSLADFYKHDYFRRVEPEHPTDKVGKILGSMGAAPGSDFGATIRGVRKNLILLDMFLFNNRNDPFFQRSQELLKKAP